MSRAWPWRQRLSGDLLTGFAPVLLPREDVGGALTLPP